MSDDGLLWVLILLAGVASFAYLFFGKRSPRPNLAEGALFCDDAASVTFKGKWWWSMSLGTVVSVTERDLRIASGPWRSMGDHSYNDGPTAIPRSSIRSVESARSFWRNAPVVKVNYDTDGFAVEVQLAVRDPDKLLAILSTTQT